MQTTYKIVFQLGGSLRVNHKTLAAAITARNQAESRARKEGDEQTVSIIAIEDGCERPLTDAEFAQAYPEAF